MTDTPDFDKMSPEEIMKWMESLAVRQGVTEGLTTSADAQIADIKDDDERLKDKGEYIPYGMKKEDWEKQKAKEEEQKRQRLAAQPPAAAKPAPQPVQAPPPPPPPVQAAPPPPPAQPAPAAAASDTPDFDKMSPEEIMKWMESLAVRQGVTEGLTTSADAQIAEVKADDERLQGKGDYIPFGMKQEDWEKQKAREEEQKKQRLASKPATPPAASAPQPSTPAPQPVAEPMNSLNDFLNGDLPTLDNEIEEETVLAQPASDPVNWLASLTDDSADDNFNFGALNEADDPLAALAQLSANDSANDMDWLSNLGGDTGMGLESLADLVGTGTTDEADDPLAFLNSLAEPSAPAAPAATPATKTSENSLEWLESMARDQGANPEELMTPASLNVERPKNVRPDGPGYTPYSFESASDSTSDEAAVPADSDILSFLTEGEDASEDWLDEVARNVSTEGHAPKTPGRSAEPAPKADVVDDVMARLNTGKEVDPNDISKMFESFFQQAEQYADRDLNFDEPVDAPAPDDIPDEALKAEIPDWLRDQMISSPLDEAPSADAQKMDDLMKMLDEEAPPLESFTAQAAEPVSEMPDWLRSTPDDDIPALQTELTSMGDDDLPDWLQGGDVDETIFAEESPWDTPGLLQNNVIEDSDDLGELIDDEEEPERAFELDTSDRWVEALTLEEEAGDQLAQWYAEKTGVWSGDEMPDLEAALATPTPSAVSPSQPAKSGALKAAQLPMEAVLMLGDPEGAPEWLTGTASMPAPTAALSQALPAEIAVAEDDSDIPDWLREQTEQTVTSTDMDDIPDWLRDQVDDTVTNGADGVPSWLAADETTVEAGDDLPDWLRETMAEEDTPSIPTFTPAPTATIESSAPTVVMSAPVIPEPVPAKPAPTPSVAITPTPSTGLSPVPTRVNIDVASTLQAARGKVSSGDVAGSLADYEMIVRANASLDEVVKDLSKLADHKDHKKNPALYRVLGDTLMRRGELKTALETYRKALHML